MNHTSNFPELKITIIIFGALAFFYLYYYTVHSPLFKKKFHRQNIRNEIRFFLAMKTTGFIAMGVIPGLLYFLFLKPSMSLSGYFDAPVTSSLIIIPILAGVILLMTFLNQKSNPERSSLQMKIREWNLTLFALNAFGWILYLLAYEFLFRGILLFECYNSFGFWPAIAVNVTIYSAIHMINSKDEAIGALLFGTIACYFALRFQTILIPVFMHIALSISSDYFSIKINKDLKFITSATHKSFNL